MRSVLWKDYLEALYYLDRLEKRHLSAMLAERLPSAEAMVETAHYSGRRFPAQAIAMLEQAQSTDPRIPFSAADRAALEYFRGLEARKPGR
jgi:hypothetical protein